MIPNGSLSLVTACDKTSSWGLASFSNASGGEEISLKFTAAQLAAGNASYTYKWETSSPAAVRVGPPSSSDQDTPEVQKESQSWHRRLFTLVSILLAHLLAICHLSSSCAPPSVVPPYENQCVFIRGLRISMRDSAFAKLKGQIKLSLTDDIDPDDVFNRSKNKHIPFASDRSYQALALDATRFERKPPGLAIPLHIKKMLSWLKYFLKLLRCRKILY
jgi:hypothetical protein